MAAAPEEVGDLLPRPWAWIGGLLGENVKMSFFLELSAPNDL